MPVRFQVDPDFYDHPKTINLSDAAVALWTRAGSYSTHKLLDGFVPDGMLARLSRVADEASAELVRQGLWKRVRGGFRFHEWDHRNLTKAEVEADRAYEREKKRRQRQEGKPQASHTSVPTGLPTGVPRDSRGSPSGSVSVSESVSVSGSGLPPGPPNGASPSPPEPPLRCPQHVDNPNPPPCGPCADARRNHDRWEAERATRLRYAPQCRKHRGELANNCRLCRAEQLAAKDTA